MHATIRSIAFPTRKPLRLLLLLIALLTPLVLGLGIYFKLTRFQSEDFRILVTRTALIQTATRFLEDRGVVVPDHAPVLRIVRNEEYLSHLHWLAHHADSPVSIPALPVGPAVFVLDFSDNPREPKSVTVTPDGRIAGFAIPPTGAASVREGDPRQVAITLAETARAAVLRFPERYLLSEPRVYELTPESGESSFRIEWTATHSLVPELSFQLRFTVGRDSITAQEIEADVDDAAVAASGFTNSLRSVLSAVAPLYFLALVLYMLIRYLQRAVEKEVSHGRALVVGLYLIAILAAVFAAGDAQLLLNLQVDGPDSLFAIAFAVFLMGLLAFLGGACYAACEGDVRERFPRSLTSFDALLTGRILSRNVARAFLVGFAAACWIFALQVAVNLQFEGGIEEPGSVMALYQFIASKSPFLYIFLLMPVGVGMVMLFGYLAPLSVVARLPKARQLGWIVLGLMSFTNLTILHGGFASTGGLLISVSLEAIILLRLIVAVDLLTAYVCLVLGGYITLLTDAQLLTSFPSALQWLMHGVVAATVFASLALLRWGRELSDEDVRPAYARALAERQSLSQQLSTAALAQQQLMLRELPAVGGFSLAAECRPARAVSGDYFDCFPLGHHRVGLFVISGAGRGLLDAMVIAFAKGFLLHHAPQAKSPLEIIASLMDALTAVLEPSDRFPELCFVVLDGQQRTAIYARTQAFPELIRVRERSGSKPAIKGGGSAEVVVTRTLSGGRSVTLSHGSAPLDESTTFLLFTCGFSSSLHLSGVPDIREWLEQQWERIAAADTQVMLRRISAATIPRSRTWQPAAPQEDLTLLVARFVGQVRAAQSEDPDSERAA